MVSQFISPDKVGLLGDLAFKFPDGIHAIGRLDNESEGLLILTTNKKITRLLFSADTPHQRTYLVMVKNEMSDATISRIRSGITIPIKCGQDYIAKPDAVSVISNASEIYLYATDPRMKYPHTWLLITLTEGKFRQVRKMVQAAGHHCLRLIRISIDGLQLGDLQPGQVKEIDETEFCKQTRISLT